MMSMYKLTTTEMASATVVLLLSLIIFFAWYRRTPKGLRLPPGPPGKLIVGNASDMPKDHDWLTYTQWAKEYGDLVHIQVFGQHMVFVNSIPIAHDLFDSRSSLYSDRYQLTMLGELAGFNWSFSFMPYGERWRRYRKTFHQYFHPLAVAAYYEVQARHTRDLLVRLYGTPEDLFVHLRHLSGAVILEVIYGVKVLPKHDPYIDLAERAVAAATQAVNPGSFLVDTFPILKYVPEWMPGAGFQKKARQWRVLATELTDLPFTEVKNAFLAGKAPPSYVASQLNDLSLKADAPPDSETVISHTAAQAYGAGSDTTVSVLKSFFLAMVLFPEVQQKAQAELDAIVGMDRLPTFEDRDRLPYINAVCQEVHRWHPVLPLGVPHLLTQDDAYGEYFIPGGSLVVGNIWGMLHDEKLYGEKPDEFRPERFLKPGVPDPTVSFGFGRRICPGRHMARNLVFIAVASIFALFDISPAKDENGKDIPVVPEFSSGFVSHPLPFKYQIKPRSESAERLIRQIVD